MKEFKIVPGVRRWHGSEFVDLQKETLDVLQAFFSKMGPCVLQGCEVSLTPGPALPPGSQIYDVTAGLVCINSEWGWKVARVPAVTGTPLPRYLIINRAPANKLYDDGNNHLASETFTGILTAVAPSDASRYITFGSSGGKSYVEAVGDQAWTSWANVTPVSSIDYAITGALYYRKNLLTNMLQVRGALTIGEADSVPWPATYLHIWTLPTGFRPATRVPFTLYFRYDGSTLRDTTDSDYIAQANGEIGTDGKTRAGLRGSLTASTSYVLEFNCTVPLG